MLRREAQRLAKAKAPGINGTCIACFAFGLVDTQDHPRAFFAQDVGEYHVGGGHAGPSVDQEQADVCHLNRAFRQAAHTALKAVVGDILEPGRVNHREAQVKDFGIALAQVARDAGLVIDQRQFAPDEAVEQGGFAHVGAADYGQGKAHFSPPGPFCAGCRSSIRCHTRQWGQRKA